MTDLNLNLLNILTWVSGNVSLEEGRTHVGLIIKEPPVIKKKQTRIKEEMRWEVAGLDIFMNNFPFLEKNKISVVKFCLLGCNISWKFLQNSQEMNKMYYSPLLLNSYQIKHDQKVESCFNLGRTYPKGTFFWNTW